MKLRIGDYEVTINAHDTDLHEKNNKEDTKRFLNEICCYIGEATYRLKEMGLNHALKRADTYHTDIFNALDGTGYYDSVK